MDALLFPDFVLEFISPHGGMHPALDSFSALSRKCAGIFLNVPDNPLSLPLDLYVIGGSIPVFVD